MSGNEKQNDKICKWRCTMNIKEAKEQIKNAMTAYFTKDQFGNYIIPMEQQRPVFLMGPPGIGKTAIMKQIASELGVGLVSYSMTHHTRQSALGLPFIMKKAYGDKEYDVSEYTMSEIIASVYDAMEGKGIKEGILFLDEINCVSETLAPSMLQFLQYKIFGRHQVPKGWIVVTAGNPPEYNNSVREFDIATWDRLKRIDVEPDYDVWKEYAYKQGIHPVVTTYLDIKKGNFYKIETTVDGKNFVTARGWSDLSDMIHLYEQHSINVDDKLVSQYLQDSQIAMDFTVYYDLFNKYKSDYQVNKILEGKADENIKDRARKARFDERLSLLGLLLDGITEKFRQIFYIEETVSGILEIMKTIRQDLMRPDADAFAALEKQQTQRWKALEDGRQTSSLSQDDQYIAQSIISVLEEQKNMLLRETSVRGTMAFKLLKADFDIRRKSLEKLSDETGKRLSNLFAFCKEVFADGQEVLILITELTINFYATRFIGRYGCKEYYTYSKELLFYERQQEIIRQIENINWDMD